MSPAILVYMAQTNEIFSKNLKLSQLIKVLTWLCEKLIPPYQYEKVFSESKFEI